MGNGEKVQHFFSSGENILKLSVVIVVHIRESTKIQSTVHLNE